MLKKTLIATATVGALAVGSLFATTAGAAASGPGVQFGGPGWNITVGGGYGPGFHGGQRCQPIVKNVKFWTRWGKPYWKQVVVGQNCFPVRHGGPHGGPFPGGPFPGGPHGGPFPGGPGGPNGGPHGGPQGPGGWGNW